ncbi:hypothetical protein JCM30471_29760 [Desulfuromonas carbonis]
MSQRHTSTGKSFSASYYSQVENGKKVNIDKVSLDFLWAVGAVLSIDPLLLFVASRPDLPDKFLDATARDRLFKIRTYKKEPTDEIEIRNWPTNLPAQITAVYSLISQLKRTTPLSKIKKYFINPQEGEISEILDSLVSLGKAKKNKNGYLAIHT